MEHSIDNLKSIMKCNKHKCDKWTHDADHDPIKKITNNL